jgi:hypothetical protein
MNRPPTHPRPPSQPSPYRYLGRGGGERPVRLQIVIALVAGLILVAVPLYLWRRPRPESIPSADAAVAADAGTPPPPDAGMFQPTATAPPPPNVQLSSFTPLKCTNPGPGKTPPERCDHMILRGRPRARHPRQRGVRAVGLHADGKVSFVLEIDFPRKRTNLFIGKSSTLKKEKGKELLRCVSRGMPTADWGTIVHQYVKYQISVAATYAPSSIF